MASNYKGLRDVKKEHYEMGILLTEDAKKEILGKAFRRRVGYEMNLDDPQTFNEKIMWTKLYEDYRGIAPYPVTFDEARRYMKVITRLRDGQKVWDMSANRDKI